MPPAPPDGGAPPPSLRATGCKCWDKSTNPADIHGDVEALVSLGFDAVKFDACAPAAQNLSRYAELLDGMGKQLLTEQVLLLHVRAVCE